MLGKGTGWICICCYVYECAGGDNEKIAETMSEQVTLRW